MDWSTLVGRDQERRALEAFLDEVTTGAAALVLAGEAGIGKTVLWELGVESAAQRFGRVLTCRGVAAEMSLSFAGLSELLAPVLEQTLGCLVAPRRRALEIALLLVDPGETPPDAHVIGLAVLDVLHALAEQGPVVIAIDDLQWLDAASAGVLQLALRRLRGEPVGVLATVRESPDASVTIELERCFAEDRLRRLTVGPLDLAALYHLLRQRLQLDLSRPELVRLHETTAGNPMFALELGRELMRVGSQRHPGQPLPVPGGLGRLLGARLDRLAVETRGVLLIVALSARPTTELVVAAHGDARAASVALDEAVTAGIVVVDDGRVRFTHPLFASVLHERAQPGRRRDVHRVLADAVGDAEERARHRARAAAGADAGVAAEVEAAAHRAAARGATAAGAELYELAAELSTDDETRRLRQLRVARLHRLAGDVGRAVALLEQLLTQVGPGVERSDILFELAMLFRVDPRQMRELCDAALDQAAGDDARAARILANRTEANLWGGDVGAALVDARRSLERAEQVGDPTLLAVAIARIGIVEAYGAEVTPGLLERGVEIEDRYGLELDYYESPRHGLARLLMRQGELDQSRTVLHEWESLAIARGDERSRVMVLWALGMLDWFEGRLEPALAYATTARELAEQTQHEHGLVWVGRLKALVEADLGRVDEARSTAREGLAYAEAAANAFFTVVSLGSLGRVELALGNLVGAADLLRDLPARLLARGIHDPTVPVWADAIEALLGIGELDQARAYLEHYELHARTLPGSWVIASAARCRALLTAATGDLAGAVTIAEHATADLADTAYALEHGRALLAVGSLHRQAQHKGAARAALDQAVAIFSTRGARPWADRARSELRRISGRRPASVLLTENELQVARLAADGRSNPQIAATLHMGISTVEAHLSRVYRKLGARRGELAARLPNASEDAANTREDATQT
jgi:ATP/maltotriose-dependent transcriptional regulator MalT